MSGLFGFSASSSSNEFQRWGTTVNSGTYKPTAQVASLINAFIANTTPGAVDTNLETAKKTALGTTLARTDAGVPGYAKLTDIIGQSAIVFPGSTTLDTMVLRDPYSADYENATVDDYKQRCADALAQVATGPDAVRGGASQTGVAQGVASEKLAVGRGEEVRRAQVVDHTNVLNAIKTRNEIETSRLNQSMLASNTLNGIVGAQESRMLQAGQVIDAERVRDINLLQVASKLSGTMENTQQDNLAGKGYQSGNSMNASIGF